MLASFWFDGLQRMNEGVLIVAVVTIGGIVIAVTSIVVGAWRRIRQSEARSGLVGMMLQRGMSAAEIERVLAASVGPAVTRPGAQEPEAHIIKLMKENDYSGDDVERVLDAARNNGSIDAGAVRLIESLVEQGVDGREIENLLDARSPRVAQATGR